MARLLRSSASRRQGPQQREMRKAFRQAKQVGVGPNKRLSKESQRTTRVGVAETAP